MLKKMLLGSLVGLGLLFDFGCSRTCGRPGRDYSVRNSP